MKKPKSTNAIIDQAVIVVSVLSDGSMLISSHNNGRSKASKLADAICRMAAAVIENPPVPKGEQ